MANFVHMIDSLRIGGAQTHLVTMLRTIPAYRIGQHRVVSLFDDGSIGDEIRELGIPVEVLNVQHLLAKRRYRDAVTIIKDALACEKPDIVEAHLTYSRLLGLLAARQAGVPVRVGFEQGDIYLRSWKFRLANFFGQRLSDRIIVCSQALADWNHRVNGFSRKRMAVLHNCVDVSRFNPMRFSDSPPAFQRQQCRTLFCVVGTLGSGVNKRVDVSIRAIAQARAQGADVGLVIAGDGEQREALERLTRDLGIQNHVLFLGMRSDIPEIMAASDAFCHAAPFEPFGIVCVEAMAMQLPVVVPNQGGMQEAVDDGETGYIYPALDHVSLARCMVRLDADPEMSREMGRRARRVAETRFSACAYMDRLNDIYSKLLTSTGV